MADEITADRIAEYLSSRDDFDLELTTYRTLREHGWDARLLSAQGACSGPN